MQTVQQLIKVRTTKVFIRAIKTANDKSLDKKKFNSSDTLFFFVLRIFSEKQLVEQFGYFLLVFFRTEQ